MLLRASALAGAAPAPLGERKPRAVLRCCCAESTLHLDQLDHAAPRNPPRFLDRRLGRAAVHQGGDRTDAALAIDRLEQLQLLLVNREMLFAPQNDADQLLPIAAVVTLDVINPSAQLRDQLRELFIAQRDRAFRL